MRRLAISLLLALAATQAGAQASSPDAAPPPSEAEQLLFMRQQLATIHEPRTLAYEYVARAGDAPGKTDRVTLTLAAAAGGHCCSTHVDFLSGPLAIALPDLDDPQGNPIVMYFLESEVRQLEQATHGQSSHFRRRIRQTLADDAKVTDTTVHWNGKDVPARIVHIAPFVTDPYRQRFEHDATTEYEFVLSDAVPGAIVRLGALLPGAKAGDPPLAVRTLTLADPQPVAPAAPVKR